MSDNKLSAEAKRLGETIRSFRGAARLSQGELADAIGVHRPTISTWERGLHTPTAANLEDIARVLGTTVAQLRAGVSPSITERAGQHNVRALLRLPPSAYQRVFEHCGELAGAGVPEELVEEARRLMSGETFNTLNKGQSDKRSEGDWLKDIETAWAFIRDQLKARGFKL